MTVRSLPYFLHPAACALSPLFLQSVSSPFSFCLRYRLQYMAVQKSFIAQMCDTHIRSNRHQHCKHPGCKCKGFKFFRSLFVFLKSERYIHRASPLSQLLRSGNLQARDTAPIILRSDLPRNRTCQQKNSHCNHTISDKRCKAFHFFATR